MAKKALKSKPVKKVVQLAKKTVAKQSARSVNKAPLVKEVAKSEVEVLQTPIEELRSMNEKLTIQLEQAYLQLDQFAHTTSHEFQEPLRKIVTFARMLQQTDKKLKPKALKDYLVKIDTAAMRLKKLFEDMLSFASVTNYEKLFVKTDLNEVLKNTLFDFELLIDEKKARVISHKLPYIEAVPFQMNQLFYDLIHNALKFSKEDVPPVIVISSHKLTKAEKKLHPHLKQELSYHEITFKDNGIGFDQKYAEQIFTMFQRLSAGGNYPGTGIGLAICKKIVQTSYGEIFVEGIENKGAVIHVILPIKQPTKVPEDISTVLKTWV
ncbi:MAG: ATP-binding protein [Bacteroidia bacterium]